MLHQWFTCVHLLDTYLANLKEGFQLSFHYPSVSIRAAQSGLQSVPAYRMRWGCHHLFRSYDGNPSNIANIRLHSVSGHTIFSKVTFVYVHLYRIMLNPLRFVWFFIHWFYSSHRIEPIKLYCSIYCAL